MNFPNLMSHVSHTQAVLLAAMCMSSVATIRPQFSTLSSGLESSMIRREKYRVLTVDGVFKRLKI